MRIFEFIDKYCSEIVKAAREKKELLDLTAFPFDDFMTDNDGVTYPAILVDTILIPIEDIFTLNRDDFVRIHTVPHAGEAYDNYVANLCILEGEDAVSHIRLVLQAESRRVKESVEKAKLIPELVYDDFA